MAEENIISQELLDILACPLCKQDVKLLEYRKGHYGLKCGECKRIYPIQDGIPIVVRRATLPDGWQL